MSIYLKQSDSVDLLTSQSDVLGKTVTLHYVSTNLLSGNSGVYLDATGYPAAHSYVFYGYLICK